MCKLIPEELTNHILPFDWDVGAVWSLTTLPEYAPIERYLYLLKLPMWSSIPGRGMLFDTCPMEVIAHPKQFPYQTQRINDADESYPIDMVVYCGRKWILDGVHRLAKLYRSGMKEIAVRIHSEEVIGRIRTPDNSPQRNSKAYTEL